jgi:hypothetical protein
VVKLKSSFEIGISIIRDNFCFMQLKFADAGQTYEANGINVCAVGLRQVRR